MPHNLPIQDRIPVSIPIDSILVKKWNTAVPDVLKSGGTTVGQIEPTIAHMYIHDFYGLLTHLGIPLEYHYPHLVANGYYNPTAYLGKIRSITLLDTSLLRTYLDAFTRR